MAYEASEDAQERRKLQAGHNYEGKVVKAPATVSEGLLVRLSDGELTYGPMAWPGARGVDLPDVGDDVLFTISEDGQFWCVVWWPYGEIA